MVPAAFHRVGQALPDEALWSTVAVRADRHHGRRPAAEPRPRRMALAIAYVVAARVARIATGRVADPIAPISWAAASAGVVSKCARVAGRTAFVAKDTPHPTAAAAAEQRDSEHKRQQISSEHDASPNSLSGETAPGRLRTATGALGCSKALSACAIGKIEKIRAIGTLSRSQAPPGNALPGRLRLPNHSSPTTLVLNLSRGGASLAVRFQAEPGT
jgi:hypothetical protein